MIIGNRRDIGYTLISRFEETLRAFIIEKLELNQDNLSDFVPRGVISKALERAVYSEKDISIFFHNIDFPDLKDILIYQNNWEKTVTSSALNSSHFCDVMDQLYSLRCKIAHVKGYFTSIDLDCLVSLVRDLNGVLKSLQINELIENIYKNPNDVVIKIPDGFILEHYHKKTANNLPTPDFDYEGGFVGREEDRRKIKSYLTGSKFPVVTITGAGGVGKTSLALKIVQELLLSEKLEFDAIIWMSAKENKLTDLGIEEIEPAIKSYEELLDSIISIFAFSDLLIDQSIEAKIDLTNKIFEITNSILLVIDNLETITDERIINFIIDAPENIKFLITSRKGIGQVERRYELKELKDKEAVFLFRQLAKDKQLLDLAKLPETIIKEYVKSVSYFPLAIKWLVGQVARGRELQSVINTLKFADNDVTKFCFDQIFNSLPESCQHILFVISLMENSPTRSILQHILELDTHQFEDAIEQLILVSLIIPEQFLTENKELSTKYNILPLTRGFLRLQLAKNTPLKNKLSRRIIDIESTVTESLRAQKEYKHSLYNFGAATDEEKIATIICQNAWNKYQSGQYEQAVDEYKRAASIAPSFAPVYRNWGVMESYENHLSEAIQLIERASKLNPSDPQIYLMWGNIYRKSGRHAESHEKYDEAFKISPNDPIILNALGQAKSRLGHYEEAHGLFLKSIENDGSFNSNKHKLITTVGLCENLLMWADLQYKNRDPKGALAKNIEGINYCIASIREKIYDHQLFNTLTKANYQLAILYLNTNKSKKAIDILIKTTKARNNSDKRYVVLAYIELMEYYYKMGSIEEIDFYLQQLKSNEELVTTILKSKDERVKDKFRYFSSLVDAENRINGIIDRVSVEKEFVIIISDDNSYIGGPQNFIPKLTLLDPSLRQKKVTFRPIVKEKDLKEKRSADDIRLITDLS